MEKKENSTAFGPEKEESRISFSPKRKKLIAVAAVISVVAIALAIGLWGNTPVPYMTVSEAVKSADRNLDKDIEVKGTVEKWNSTIKAFLLTDEESSLNVSYTSLPDGFNNGKEIVVKGILRNDSGLRLEATEIIIGCPSKY